MSFMAAGWIPGGRVLYWFGNLTLNPYFAGLLTLLCFTCAVSAFLLLWDKVWGNADSEAQKKSDKLPFLLAWMMCGLLWISHPIMTEQFYFTLQSAEIGMGILLTAAALYLVYSWQIAMSSGLQPLLSKNLWKPVVAVLLLLVTFSVYQTFVVIYIFGAVSVILLQCLREILTNEKGEGSTKKLLFPMIPHVAVFLVAFVLNMVITGSFFQTSSYLQNQIQWGQGAITDNFRYIGGHIIKSMTGYEGIYYNLGYGILCLMTVATVVTLLIVTGQKKSHWVIVLFYLAALLSTPYLMTIVIGGTPACRSQLVLPMITGFLAYLTLLLVQEMKCLQESRGKKSTVGAEGSVVEIMGSRVLLCGVILGCILGIWTQTQTTMQLYYTDSMRYEQDVAVARELMNRIEQLCAEEDVALVVVGSKPFAGNNACLTGEMMGTSFFDHDVDVEPPCYWSTKRVLGLFHLLGANYDIAPEERFHNAIQFSKNMPAWPAEDCVQEQEGVIVVKMSEYE